MNNKLLQKLSANSGKAARCTLKRLCISAALVALCSGCVSHRSCIVTSSSTHTDLELRKDWHGLVPGICGFTTHASCDYTFRLPGEKSEYADKEIQGIGLSAKSIYTGTISILRNQKRVVVKLNEDKHAFELNGKYWYH